MKAGIEIPAFMSHFKSFSAFAERPIQPTISVSENQYAISTAAVSGASEP